MHKILYANIWATVSQSPKLGDTPPSVLQLVHGCTALHAYTELSDTKGLLVRATTSRTSGAEQKKATDCRIASKRHSGSSKTVETENGGGKDTETIWGMTEILYILITVFV